MSVCWTMASAMHIGPGDIMVIEPGHDAWTVGDEACVLLDTGVAAYAKPVCRRLSSSRGWVLARRHPEDLVLGVRYLGTGRVDGDLHVVALLRVRLAREAQGVGGLAVEVVAGAAGRVLAHEDL